MDSLQLETQSFWQRIDKPFSPPLGQDLSTDVCIVGAGIAGLTTAYQLLLEGKDVVVIDRERLGINQTGLTSAHLSFALDDGLVHLRRLHGLNGLRLALDSHKRAIDEIERIIKVEEIDCDFKRVDGFQMLGPGKTKHELEDELQAAHDAGLSEVELLPHAPTELFDSGPCLRYPNQAQFHPVKYLLGLLNAVQKKGGKVFSHTMATDIRGGFPARVTTAQGALIHCQSIVMATHVPTNHRLSLQTKIAAYRSYMIGLRIPAGSFPQILLWDNAEPYHYVRTARDPDSPDQILLIGGEDHRTGHEAHPEERFHRLHTWAQERLHLPEAKVMLHWSGQIIEPMDGLAFIGRSPGDPENIYLITGDSGHGLTHGTLGGMLVRDLIVGRENPWVHLYDPARVNLKGLGTYLKETAQSTLPYSDWFTSGEIDSVEKIPAGEGAVVREGLKKAAVYRDHSGQTHTFSAVCPHLGGILRWNTSEKTWDCPCHGSRFSKDGEVLNGPANHGLNEIQEPHAEENLPASLS